MTVIRRIRLSEKPKTIIIPKLSLEAKNAFDMKEFTGNVLFIDVTAFLNMSDKRAGKEIKEFLQGEYSRFISTKL